MRNGGGNVGKWINLDDLPSGRVEWGDILDAPSIDIVRCAECKWWRNTDAEKIPTASIACGNMHADDFCSYGERREP